MINYEPSHLNFYSQGAFHQRRSNLGSAELGSTLIVDFNQVQVMMRRYRFRDIAL